MKVPSTCSSLLRTGTIVGHAPQYLIIEISAQESCEQCAQGRGCGLGLLSRRRAMQVAVKLPADSNDTDLNSSRYPSLRYSQGSLVTISLPRTSITQLAFFVYGLPLLLALLLSGLVALVSNTVWLAPLSFFFALVVSALTIKCLMSGRGERFRPRLVN